jgi:hypothetical protein
VFYGQNASDGVGADSRDSPCASPSKTSTTCPLLRPTGRTWLAPPGMHRDGKSAAVEYHDNNHQSVAKIEPERQQPLRRLMDDDVSLERAWSELNGQPSRGEAAATTVEALTPTVLRDERRS